MQSGRARQAVGIGKDGNIAKMQAKSEGKTIKARHAGKLAGRAE